jgi:AraC-like DNA-binding protein
MKKSWMTRLMISYLPVYLVSTSAIIIFLALSIVHAARDDLNAANRAMVTQICYNVDDLTNRVDRSTVKSLYLNRDVAGVLTGGLQTENNSYYTRYKMFDAIRDFMISNSEVLSVYLYSKSDGSVLTDGGLYPLADFYDRDFMQGFAASVAFAEWSGARQIPPIDGNRGENVVSLVRNVADSGLIVVNVTVQKLRQTVDDLQISPTHYARLTDGEGNVLVDFQADEAAESTDILNTRQTKSGWQVQGSLVRGKRWSAVRISSILWLGISAALIVIGILSIRRQSKKNYAPIARIVSDIQEMDDAAAAQPQENEFSLISRTIHAFSSQVEDYRRSRQIREVLLGRREPPDEPEHAYILMMLEVDKDSAGENRLERCDRLQSYILNQWDEENCGLAWSGWMTDSRLALLWQDSEEEQLTAAAARISAWIHQQGKPGAVIGISGKAESAAGLPAAYQEACMALDHKAAHQSGDVIVYTARMAHEAPQSKSAIETIQGLVELFQNGSETWRGAFDKWNDALMAQEVSCTEAEHQYRLLVEGLDTMIRKRPAVFISAWEKLAAPSLNAILAQSDYLSEISEGFRSVLQGLFDQYAAISSEKKEHAAIGEIRSLIDSHYADPDLSLSSVADMLGMNPNYISTLIKEETGIPFTRMVSQRRMDAARGLLETTGMQINAIAEAVGFQNVISFNRIFKQTVGMTPGEYRKNAQRQQLR